MVKPIPQKADHKPVSRNQPKDLIRFFTPFQHCKIKATRKKQDYPENTIYLSHIATNNFFSVTLFIHICPKTTRRYE